MVTWTLIVFTFAGAMSKGDSVALTSVDGFKSLATCSAAGEVAKRLSKGTIKDTKFVCVEVK